MIRTENTPPCVGLICFSVKGWVEMVIEAHFAHMWCSAGINLSLAAAGSLKLSACSGTIGVAY